MKKGLVGLIRLYQKIVSPDQGLLRAKNVPSCTFYPSCSEYAILVIEKDGVTIGIWRALRRIAHCHPWQKNHIDLP